MNPNSIRGNQNNNNILHYEKHQIIHDTLVDVDGIFFYK